MYTTDYREAPDRDGTATDPGESCDHERTVFVEPEGGSGGSLTCRDCGTTMPAEPGDRRVEGGLAASCRWVLTRVGGRY